MFNCEGPCFIGQILEKVNIERTSLFELKEVAPDPFKEQGDSSLNFTVMLSFYTGSVW